jgi:hypothetical protein
MRERAGRHAHTDDWDVDLDESDVGDAVQSTPVGHGESGRMRRSPHAEG